MKGAWVLLARRMTGWRPWQYAAFSIGGLVGMLVLEGWLHSVMLGLTVWPAVIAACSCLKARKTDMGS